MRSHKGIFEAINMSRKIYAPGKETEEEDFKLPPANKHIPSHKSTKTFQKKGIDRSSTGGSKSSTRGPGTHASSSGMNSKNSNFDYEGFPGEGIPSIHNQTKIAALDDDLDTSGLTEKQQLSLLKNRIMDQRKELENRNEIVTALQRNFEALSMFCKKERAENQALKLQNDKLSDENKKFIDKITTMSDKIKCLSADNELLAKDRVRAKHLTEEVQDLKIKMKVLETQIDQHKNNAKRLNDLADKTKNDLDKVRKDYKIETEKVASLTEKLNDVKASIDDINKKHEREMMDVRNEYKVIIEELRNSLAKVKGNSAKEQDNLLEDLQKARNHIKDLEKQLIDAQKALDTKEILLKDQTNKIEELTESINYLKSNLKSGTSTFEAEKQDLLNQIKELNKSKDVLKAQYSELANRLKQITDEGLNKDQALSLQLEAQAKTVQSLNSKIEALKKEKDDLNAAIDHLNQRIFSQKLDHESQVKDLEFKHQQELGQKDERIQELQMEVRMMGQKLASSNKDNNSSERELNGKIEEINQLKKELGSLTERVRVLLGELDQKQGEVDKKQKEMEEREKLHESKLSQFQKKCNDYEAQIKSVNDELEAQKQKFNDLLKGEDVVKKLEYEITMLKKQHAEECNKLKESIEREVRAKMGLENKHREKVHTLENQIGILNKDVTAKIEEIDRLNREIKKQRNVSDLFKDDIDKQKMTIRDLTQTVADLTQKLESAEKELSEL